MISFMFNLMVVVFKHLEIISNMDVDKSIKYTEHIMRVSVLNKNRQILVECKESAKGLSGYQWTLRSEKKCDHGTVMGLGQGGRYQRIGRYVHWTGALFLP